MTNNNLISAALFTPNSVEFPNAWVGHLHFAAWVINEISPKIFVELGTHSGNSYFSFCQSVSENHLPTKCYAVDTWIGDDHSGKYNDDIFNKVNAHNQKHYAEFSKLLRMTFDDASTYFAEKSINVLHIDGLHTYEAVRHDFETWLPKLATDAIVIFHDTNVRERNFGVWKLWEELQGHYPNNIEFKHSNGLGVLQLNNPEYGNNLKMLQSTYIEKQLLINYFAALGSQQLKLYELNEIKQLNTILNQTLAECNQQIANYEQKSTARDESFAFLEKTILEYEEKIATQIQTVAELDVLIVAINQAVSERDRIIDSIKNSFLWKVTRPAQKVINKINPLRVLGLRAKKVIWWILTLQTGRKYREWQLSRKVANSIHPHFSPPKDDYTFKVPFDYKLEKSNFVPKLAVIFHVYYPELIEEFKGYLANIPFTFDLFITTDTEEKKIDIANQLLDWNNGALEIRISQNRGRDIAPKLISCRDVYDRYEFFLHIHTKKSPHHSLLSGWRTYLLDTLLGSREIVTSVFEAFESDPKLGMIAPEHFDTIRPGVGWGWNFDAAKKFASGLNINLLLDNKVDFPSGSMFWGRSAALRPLLSISLSTDDFQLEGSQTDGTLGHIIERLYYFICEKAGYRWVKIVRPELLKNVERVVFVNDKVSLNDLINQTQYHLINAPTDRFHRRNLSKQADILYNWRLVHSKSNLRTMEFSDFCKELEKHTSNQESLIDFDEAFYFNANPDLAENGVTCGFIHYCLAGQYENRIYSDGQLKNRMNVIPCIGKGLFFPTSLQQPHSLDQGLFLDHKPQSNLPILLILLSHLQEEFFFAGYSEFFKDHALVFDLFNQVIIAVERTPIDKEIILKYSNKIEVMHLPEIGGLLHKPDIIIGFNAHLTCQAYSMLPNTPRRVVYYCQDYESGFFPYGDDYIIGKKAILGSQNLVVSTELLQSFLVKRNIVNDAQQVFVTRPNIEKFDVNETKTNRLFFYFRPESFHKRNLPETLMGAVSEFCNKYSGYEIFMVGSVATSYSFKINGTQIYVISKLPKNEYVELISSCDIVVAMIYSAHPGVIAFQAAASGIPTVTNVFENRDASLLRNISKNIVPYDPARENLITAIEEALTMKKGQASFNENLYSGNQQGTLVDFYSNILKAP